MQAIEPSIMGYYMPTKESQADKGIDHPFIACNTCNIAWRSYARSYCPSCTNGIGFHFILHESEIWGLMEAVLRLDDDTMFHAETERTTWMFRNLLMRHAPWYDMNSRVIIQSCYFTLLKQDPHLKVAYALGFFMAEYVKAPEDELMYIPEEDGYTVSDMLYDLQRPDWEI